MILVSLRLGAAVAEANEEQRQALTTYGRCLGLAFQITDDLLDVRGDETTMGKRVRKDSAQGKVTYPALLGVGGSVQRAQQLIKQACDAIEPLGPNGASLEALARYVLERDR
jgi:geranylgeranyl pyrophosphate synthase